MHNMPSSRKTSRKATCFFFTIILICVVITAIIGPKIILNQAELSYGPASSDLSTIQRLYLSTLILLQANDLTQPIDPDGAERSITINQGESVTSIISKLHDAGLISNPGIFRSYLQYTGLDTSLKAGEFTLSASMSPIEIATSMQLSISLTVTLTILPGWRLEEIANSLPSTGLTITPDEFIAAATLPQAGYSFSTCLSGNSLEGFMFPGSYTLARETTIGELLPQVLMNFESQVTNELRNGFSSQGLNLCQAVTLASIIQREAVITEEMPFIASVFFNRLNSGKKLESDPTVQYALGYNEKQGTWWTNPLSFNDLKFDNLFNTYLYYGLPPAPISDPGIEALQAVAFPAQTDYFYFRSACDGSGRHTFAETFEEHVGNECP
jgi:peptidoglycan lytic transglycosylase G